MSETSGIIHLCAIIRARPGMENQLKNELEIVVNKTQQEAGCIQFQIHQLKNDPTQFMLWECFRSHESLRKHIATDYTQRYFATARAYMAQPTEVIELNRFA